MDAIGKQGASKDPIVANVWHVFLLVTKPVTAWQGSHLQAVALGAGPCLQLVQKDNVVAIGIRIACLVSAVCTTKATHHRPALLTQGPASLSVP